MYIKRPLRLKYVHEKSNLNFESCINRKFVFSISNSYVSEKQFRVETIFRGKNEIDFWNISPCKFHSFANIKLLNFTRSLCIRAAESFSKDFPFLSAFLCDRTLTLVFQLNLAKSQLAHYSAFGKYIIFLHNNILHSMYVEMLLDQILMVVLFNKPSIKDSTDCANNGAVGRIAIIDS